MSYRSVSDVFYRVKKLFNYAPDSETFGKTEHWADAANEVKAGRAFNGDCDDFALTCLVVGIENRQFKPELCRIARVATASCPAPQPFDHAVAIYDGYVIDNRQSKPLAISDAMRLYRFYDYATIPITQWHLYKEQ